MITEKRMLKLAVFLSKIWLYPLAGFLFFASSVCAAPIDISDSPPEVQVKAAPANFMIGLDDSGSMDYETLVKGVSNGYFRVKVGDSYKSFAYILPNTGDNLYSDSEYLLPPDSDVVCTKTEETCPYNIYECTEWTKVCIKWQKNKPHTNQYCTQWQDTAPCLKTVCADPVITCVETSSGTGFSYRAHWRSQWAGPKDASNTNIPAITSSSAYNGMYYNPRVKYDPWYGFSNADPNTPKSHPNSSVSTKSINLDSIYNTRGTTSIPNAHYYVWSETGQQAYLVSLTGGSYKYYKVDNDKDGIVAFDEIEQVGSLPDDVKIKRPGSDGVPVAISYIDERQNFANWYTYHRKRWLSAVGAISHMVPKFSGVKVGIYSINNNIKQAVVPVKIYNPATGLTVDESSTIINAVTSYKLTAKGTPLRTALNVIGTYLKSGHTNIGSNPRASSADGGACQQNFTMLFTDGYWNDGEWVWNGSKWVWVDASIGVGNQDGDSATIPTGLGNFSGIAPYKDTYSETLADVAMKYYKNDMDTNLENVVPKNNVDQATHQHMVTYTVGFGLSGTIDRSYYSIDNPERYPTWPKVEHDTSETIDDLWHAAVNGRGKYLSASNSTELQQAFNDIVSDVSARMGSAAAITMNGTEVNDNLVFYQSIYSAAGWTGDLVAKTFPIDPATGEPNLKENPSKILWKASSLLEAVTPDNRKIITYDNEYNSGVGRGIPFRFTNLTTTQQEKLYPSSALLTLDEKKEEAGNVLNYLRGDHAKEVRFTGGVYRNRIDSETSLPSRMGDVVHSAPAFLNNVVYVGANDGMLHAFSTVDGREIFAYVPNHVFSNLSRLSRTDYTHIPYVDNTPFVKKAVDKSYLVSGLGKGGKGIFCLDITNAAGSISDESAAAGFVKWEYPKVPGSDPDMGYSFSKPYIVNTKAEGWVVIFGNGYNSTNEKSVLYILKLETGAVLAKIVAGAGPGNGLSTPNIVDVDADGYSDYVYAGDLKGNLWKFEINGDTKSEWGTAYGSNPLFKAVGSDSQPQPITSRPDAMLHCRSDFKGYIIAFGTGKWLGVTDLSVTQKQTLYGIWDYGDDDDDGEFLGTLDRSTNKLSNQPDTVTLLKQEIEWVGEHGDFMENDAVRILTDKTMEWHAVDDDAGQKPNPSNAVDNNAGWYFDLPSSGERMVSDVQIRSGNAIFITSIPSVNNPCSPEGTSWLYEINACSGGRASNSHLDVKTDGKLDDNDLITVTTNGVTKKEGASAVHYTSLLYPPSIARDADNTEVKFMSTSAGNIVGMKEKGEKIGIFYWRSY